MNKGIWAGLVAIAFVAGSITTGTMAYAAAGGQGDNLIIDAINNLAAVIQGKELEADVTAEVTIPDGAIIVNAPAGPPGPAGPQGPPGEQGPPGTGGTDTLASLSCSSGQVAKFIGGAWVCAQDNDQIGITTETDPQVGTLVNGQWCRSDGARVNCDVPPVIGGSSPLSFYTRTANTLSNDSPQISLRVSCDAGDILTGGGISKQALAPLIASRPLGNTWEGVVFNPEAANVLIEVYAICYDRTP